MRKNEDQKTQLLGLGVGLGEPINPLTKQHICPSAAKRLQTRLLTVALILALLGTMLAVGPMAGVVVDRGIFIRLSHAR